MGPTDASGRAPDWVRAWAPALDELGARIRGAVRAALAEAHAAEGRGGELAAAVGVGAGDVTFGIDAVAESEVTRWLEQEAAQRPLSLLTEDAGWRHRAPASGGGSEEVSGFDHGGPRLVLDPIDGTRPLMHDLRAAWVVLGGAGPGAGAPNLSDLDAGLLTEIPDTRGHRGRVLTAARGCGARLRELDLVSGDVAADRELRADGDPRLDRGHFPFFGFTPEGRAAAQALSRDVFQALEGIDPLTVLDDQLCSNGGQLALLACGTYRAVVDARMTLNRIHGTDVQTAKPYDLAGGIVVAREAGCVVERPDGAPLDMPIDATTPVEFAAYHNGATRAGMAPALTRALASSGG